MFKNNFLFGAFLVVSTIGSISAGMDAGKAWSGMGAATSASKMTLDEMLRRDAEAHNKRKGEKIGDAIFERASVTGRTLVLDFILPNAPRRFNAQATSDRLEGLMKSKFCNSAFAAVMRRGGGMLYRYNTPGGTPLVDARIDAATCKLG